MTIKVLGPGCPNCKILHKKTIDAVAELNLDASIEKIEDIMKIMEFGVIKTPALVIDEKIVFSGRIPSETELKQLLTQ